VIDSALLRARRTAEGTRGLVWAALGVALGLGWVISTHPAKAPLAIGLSALPLLIVLPLADLAVLSVVVALAFRLLAPSGTGAVALAPDVLALLVVGRAVADAGVRGGRTLPPGVRRMLWAVGVLACLALASAVVNGGGLMTWGQSMRQFVRFPLWGAALLTAGLTWREARKLVKALLVVSLVQFPLSLLQYLHPRAGTVIPGVHFFQGDNVSGTFGFGGSSTEMIFLVVCAVVWLQLVFARVLPAWILWGLGPLLVVPMSLGSAASFVLFLPMAIFGIVVQLMAVRRSRLSVAGLTSAVVLLSVTLWAAAHFAIAPGFAGGGQPSGSALLSQSYLSRYFSESTSGTDPGSRLGFLKFAVEADLHEGWQGVLTGRGPALSILSPGSESALEGEPGDHSAIATRSVQSFQRLVLGYGFVAPGLFLLVVLLPVVPLIRRRSSDRVGAAVVAALPVAAVVYLAAGIYNAPWSDPGLSAAFWSLVVAANVATQAPAEVPAPMEAEPT
jgi:hypothetical protein